MADEKNLTEEPKIFLKFRANQKSPTLEIQVGEYHRSFKAEEQPFEVKDKEEELLLRNSGYFVSDKEAEAEAATEDSGPATDGTQSVAPVAPKTKAQGKVGGAPPPSDAPDAADKASS